MNGGLGGAYAAVPGSPTGDAEALAGIPLYC